jgi:DNA-binding HxlR family transcriptional regulator
VTLGHRVGTDMTKIEQCPDCNRINGVLTRVGDRWSVLRFNELKRNLGISQRMLSLTLKKLERDGLVMREQYPTIPPKVEYSLTPMGQSFRKPVSALGEWALNNLSKIDAARQNYDAAAVR